ncbi:transcription termination/antitermination protein NusA [Gemmatimonadetes bacterium T265]|nr:transcription termination/antitermination protein NusA [Gemmatimonadetes bacterium T265]
MAVSPDVLTAIRELTNAKQLDRAELFGLLQDGIIAALQKKYGPTVQAEVDIDDATGGIRIVMLKTVVAEPEDTAREISLDEARLQDEEFQVGDIYEREIPFHEFGRAAVQAAKQRIVQRVREGERTRIKDEFSSKVGELLSGEVQQIERGKIVLMLNRFREAEAIIPYREQNHREHAHQGETIRAVLKRVEDTPKGPRLVLSRADALFVQALFRLEVPEIQQGIVEIRAAAREVGSRTKIAVFSRDDAVDPVGACVGLKGARVQAVVNELGGERIDIVPWSADPERFAKLALAPAKVARVFSDHGAKTIQVIVDDDQLSLAIGRNGQNVRLASELTGWKLDLYSSREWTDRAPEPQSDTAPDGAEDETNVPLADIAGIEPAVVAVLEAGGYRMLDDILDLDRDDFLRLPGIAPAEADHLVALVESLTTEGEADEDDAGTSSVVG